MNTLKALVLAIVLSISSACIAGGPGVVAYATADGQVHVRSDGDTTIAWGSGAGSAGAFGKATGIEFVIPYQVQDGFIYLKSKSQDFEAQLPMYTPLPVWAKALFRPGEAAELDLTFEDEVPAPEPLPLDVPKAGLNS